MSDLTSIPAPRVDFIDKSTGLISREWYLFLLTQRNRIQDIYQSDGLYSKDYSGEFDIVYQQAQLASMISRYDVIISNLSQLTESQPQVQLGTLASQNADNVSITGGVISATSFNKVTITTPLTFATFTLADGKTLTVNNTINITGTDSTTMTFPSTSALVARTDDAQTFTGVQTLLSNPVLNAGSANGVVYLNGSKSATSSGTALTFTGSYLGVGVATASSSIQTAYSVSSLYSGAGVLTDAGGYTGVKLYDSGSGNLYIFNKRNSASFGNILFMTGSSPSERMRITDGGNIHGVAGGTSMTAGFFYIPAAAGTPTGTPTSITGTVPMYYDTTNDRFYVYNGSWKSVVLA